MNLEDVEIVRKQLLADDIQSVDIKTVLMALAEIERLLKIVEVYRPLAILSDAAFMEMHDNKELPFMLETRTRAIHAKAAVERTKRLSEENERFRKALEFYANADIYDEYAPPNFGRTSAAETDGGQIAREALGGDK